MAQSLWADIHSQNNLIVRHWTVEDGLPTNSVTGIAQDATGYLWLSTLDGLVRFDGMQFVTIEPPTDDWSISRRFITLRQTPDDALWLSTEQRDLVRFQNGKFRHISMADGLPENKVARVAQSPSGWLAYATPRHVALITERGIQTLAIPFELDPINSLYWPSEDRLWIATQRELIRVEGLDSDMAITRWPLDAVIHSMVEYAGSLWLGSSNGLYQWSEAGGSRQHERSIEGHVSRLAVTSSGKMLVHARAVWLVEADRIEKISMAGRTVPTATFYLPDDSGDGFINTGEALWRNDTWILQLEHGIRSLFRDREGSLWVSSDGGALYQLLETSLSTFSTEDGLPINNVYPVFQGGDGSTWAGLLGLGLVRISNEPDRQIDIVDSMDPVWTIAEIDGEIWFAGQRVCRLQANGRCDPSLAFMNSSEPFRLIYQDQSERIWLAGFPGHMWLREHGQWRLLTEQNGWQGRSAIRSVLEMDNGDLWFASNGEGLIRMSEQQSTIFDIESGLSSNFIRSLLLVDTHRFLVGSEDRGLCLVDVSLQSEVQFQCLNEDHGLPVEGGFHHLVVDEFGRLWWSSNRGIYWQTLDDILAVAEGLKARLDSGGHYDDRNGMLNSEANGGVYPAGFTDRQGRLWFPTQGGIVIVDPRAVDQLKTTPAALAKIEQIQVGERVFSPGTNGTQMPQGQRNLSLDLTALSFFDPQRIEFRYRLPTFSDEWNSLGTSRRLNLTELPPGRFPVEVAARNYLGDWQQTPTRLALDVPPYWYEYRSTRLWGLLLFFIALGIAVRWWNRRLIQRAARLQREVDERTEQLQQIYSRRSEFFANLSHELRTPLTLLLGPLSDAVVDQSTLSKNDMQVMLRSADRMKRLVDQMLDLQKIDAGQMQLQLEQVELGSFIQSAIEPFELLARQSGLRLELAIADPDLSVEMDRLQFEKVLLNLLSNAFKVSPSGSLVEVRLSRYSEQARIEVLDCGPGIPAGANERIFNRFHQEPGSYATQGQGTGIGLALVKELMQLHRGRVQAENRKSGGARLICYLPLLQTASTEALEERPPGVNEKADLRTALPPLERSAVSVEMDWSIDSNRQTILIVEDNTELRRYIREILESHYQVIQAEDGAAGIEAARRYLPDVIVSDVMMPNLDGFEMARILRADAETECIPLLFLTARGSEHDEVEGLSIGADDYLTKPFGRAVLLARIRTIFETRRRLAELNSLRLVSVESEPSEPDDLLSRSRQIIESHLEDLDFGVEALASSLHMSRSQLFRKLKTEHGLLARDLIREVRLDKAAELLRTTDASVTEVTYAVGFPSLANFSRAFSERYQTPPSKYRKAC